ncbi:TPA: hypothetical protein RU000_002859 [Klebsiella pneumoniae]|nr:hypothetical protein [Klebsiella pneumoniae]
MSEITKEPVEQVKQAFKDRISSPLFYGVMCFSHGLASTGKILLSYL